MTVVPMRPAAPTTMNPFRYFRELGWPNLLPLMPADAQVSPRWKYVQQAIQKHGEEKALAQMRGKAPAVLYEDGKWGGFKWRQYQASEADLDLWHGWGANVGFRMPSDWVIFDIDITDEKWAREAERIIVEHLGPSPCRIGLAPKRMLFYRLTDPVRGAWVFTKTGEKTEAVEMFTDGRQVALFGMHRSAGRPYQWPRKPAHRDEITLIRPDQYEEVQQALLAALPEASSKRESTVAQRDTIPQESLRGDPGMIRRAMSAIPNNRTIYPSRDDYIRMGAALKAALPDDEDEAFHLWTEWAEKDDGGSPEVWRKDWNGLGNTFAIGANWIYTQADKHGNGAFNLAEVHFDPVPEHEPSPFEVQAQKEREDKTVIDFEPWGERDLSAIPYPEFAYSDFYARGYTSVTLAPPKVGKSMLGLAEALDMASGKGILTGKQTKPLRVVYYNAEDDQHVIDSRVAALLIEYGIDQKDIADTLFPVSGVMRDDFFMVSGADPVVNEDLFTALEAFVLRVKADVLIFDPLQDLSRSPETNEVFRLLGQRLRRMASGCNVALGLIHHTRKITPGMTATIDDGRGGSALRGTARFNRLLIGMNEEEAAKAGVDNHRRFLRVADMESNLAPPSADVNRWFEKVSVTIPNGRAVGAVRPWQWPDACEGVDDMHALRVRAEIDKMVEPPRADSRSPRWVGYTVASVLGVDAQTKAGKERVKGVVARWIKDDILRIAKVRDGRAGREVEAVVSGGVGAGSASVFD